MVSTERSYLLTYYSDCVGHKLLYILCWILHGDIHIDRILISTPLSYSPGKASTTVRLIDLDHARAAPNAHTLYKSQSHEVSPYIKHMISSWCADDKIGEMIYSRFLEDNTGDNEFTLTFNILTYLSKVNQNDSESSGNEIGGGGLFTDAWNLKVTYLSIVNLPYHTCP